MPFSAEIQVYDLEGAGAMRLRPRHDDRTKVGVPFSPVLTTGEERALLPRRVYSWLAGISVLGAVVVLSLGRAEQPFALQTAVALVASSFSWLLAGASCARLSAFRRLAAAAAIGVLAAWPGYFFGPNSGFAAWLVTILCLIGVVTNDRIDALAAWLLYGTLTAGQATVFALVATGRLADASLAPVIVGSHPVSHHAAGHVFVQTVYLGAFLSARSLNRRYRAVAVHLDVARRAALIRDALLREARAEYRRAFRFGREALASVVRRDGEKPDGSGSTVTQVTSSATRTAAAVYSEEDDAVERAFDVSGAPAPPRAAWLEASNYRMRRVLLLTIAGCAVGAALLGVIAIEPGPLHVAWACIAGIAAAVVVHNLVVLRRGHAGGHWPWTLAGLLSVGPAFSTGLHSAFAAAIVAPLFLGGLFRSTDRAAWGSDRRLRIWLGIAAAHATAFLLVLVGALPDVGNVPVLPAGAPWWHAAVFHLVIQGAYAVAFAAGVAVDRRHEALIEETHKATEHAALAQAALVAASEAIEALRMADTHAIFLHRQIGRFRLQRMLGRGGMGDVYEGRDESSGERVAVKLLQRTRVSDPASLRLFAREASALARVHSPYVARVLEAADAEADVPFIAMDLVEGPSLATVLQERGRLTLAQLRDLVHDVSEGLADVHRAGVVHRDVKPHNILYTESRERSVWKLVDFGVAQIQDPAAGRRDMIVGTPSYMAPEQAQGGLVDARADLYSFCLVIYRSLTGRPAFAGEVEVARRRSPPHPAAFVQAPRDVELALRVGLSLRPGDRFTTAAELKHAFLAAIDGRLDAELRLRAEAMLAREPWTDPHVAPTPPEALPSTVSEP
jgi:hypothetical protein